MNENEAKKVTPRFDERTVISCRSLVVDENGVAWWVDPDAMTITLAE